VVSVKQRSSTSLFADAASVGDELYGLGEPVPRGRACGAETGTGESMQRLRRSAGERAAQRLPCTPSRQLLCMTQAHMLTEGTLTVMKYMAKNIN
jgi:hypothetical protein